MSAVASISTPLRSGTWAAGLPTRAPGQDACASIPGVLGWLLDYVQPLQQWWDELLGDPAGVHAVAGQWQRVEQTLRSTADDLGRARAALAPLEGRTIRLLELRYDDLLPVARDAADWSDAVAAGIRLASSIVEAVRTFVCDFLVDLARLGDALFGSLTLDPFEKIDQLRRFSDAAWEAIQSGGRLVQQMFDAFARLIELISKLGPVIEEGLAKLRELFADMLPVIGLAGGGLIGLMLAGGASDLLKDGTAVERFGIDELRAAYAANPTEELRKKIEAWEAAHGTGSLDGLSDLVAANGSTDAMGGADSTAIDVKLVRAADGSEHWVVSLPSTQEWLDVAGTGAMNDRNTNLELILMENPLLKSQYERAVLQAMREAGMAPGDPVVFTGFSQGGIMAANLASDPHLPYTTIGVVTNGSPVDTFRVPPNVPVIAFQHVSDPVPALDGNVIGATPPNVHRVVLPDPGSMLPGDTHNNANYAQSVADHARGLSAEYAWMGGEVIDHQVFTSTQN